MQKSSSNPRIGWDIVLAAAISGMAVMSIEILASRLLAPALGSSVLVWTNLIGVVLLSLAAGAWFGGYSSDRYRDRRLLGVFLFAAGISASFLPFSYQIAVWIISFIPEIYALPLLALILLAPTAFLLGAVPPAAIRLALHEVGEAGHIAGRLNAIGALGSLAGTYFTGYVLLAVWPVNWILAGISVCLFLSGIALLRPLAKKNILASLFGFSLIAVGQTAEAPEGIIIPSRYSAMRVSEHELPDGTINILWMDNARHGAAIKTDKSNSLFSFYQLFNDFSHLLAPNAKHFLSIGGGTFHASRLWISNGADRTATAIERDPAAIEASKRFFDLQDNPRLAIVHGDGRASLASIGEKFDAVFIDAYADHMTIPWHLITVEAWANLRSYLADDAFVAMNFVIHRDQSLDANRKLISGTVNAAKTSFKYVTIVNIGNKYSPTNIANTLLLLSNTREPKDEEIREILQKNKVLSDPITYPLITDAFPAFTDQYAPVEYLSAQIVSTEKARIRARD
ncbi:fused MFS/spermidine synthase [Candidatus Uhrbacteria bacterium]|nr:fused MFS/spermidine synthase [Candidatus Uhrbacteria bacterium]